MSCGKRPLARVNGRFFASGFGMIPYTNPNSRALAMARVRLLTPSLL